MEFCLIPDLSQQCCIYLYSTKCWCKYLSTNIYYMYLRQYLCAYLSKCFTIFANTIWWNKKKKWIQQQIFLVCCCFSPKSCSLPTFFAQLIWKRERARKMGHFFPCPQKSWILFMNTFQVQMRRRRRKLYLRTISLHLVRFKESSIITNKISESRCSHTGYYVRSSLEPAWG